MILEFITAILAAPSSSVIWGGLGAGAVLIINKVFPSRLENTTSKREDFRAITNSLFKEVEVLKDEIERYKKDAEHCDKNYSDLNERFIDFKRTYNELELRYNIQIRINKKLADEISMLEEEIKILQDKDKNLIINEEQKPINNPTSGTSS